MPLPNFFIIGTPRCGTSTFAEALGQHPEIYISHPKEPNFFNEDIIAEAKEHWPANKPLPFYTEAEEYQKLFPGLNGEKRQGEASTDYIYSEVAAQRIYEHNPDAKILVFFRNPIDFITSIYEQLFFLGIEDCESLTEAIKKEQSRKEGLHIPQGIRYPSQLYYIHRCKYMTHLQRYIDRFGVKQLKVILYDDFKSDNQAAYASAFRFLGVAEAFTPEIKPINRSKRLRSKKLQKLTQFVSSNNKYATSILPKSFYQFLKHRYDQILTGGNDRQTIPPDVTMTIHSEIRDEIIALGSYVNRDLLNLWKIDYTGKPE